MKPSKTSAAALAGAAARDGFGNNRKREDTRRRGNYQGDQPFEIWTTKFDGSSRFYQAYSDRKIAEGVRDRLREIGLPCEIRQVGT